MDDLKILRETWGDPVPPAPAARAAARTALLERMAEPAAAPVAARRFRPSRLAVRFVAVGALAVAVAAGAAVAQNLGGTDGGGRLDPVPPTLPTEPVSHAQEALVRAATVAETRPFTAPRPDQWIFVELKGTYPAGAHTARAQTPDTPLRTRVTRYWKSPDGRQASIEKGRVVVRPALPTMPPSDYRTLAALPTDPDALLARLYREMGGLGGTRAARGSTAYTMLAAILRDNVLPPANEAAIFRAMAKLPGVTLARDAVDVTGRPALAVGLLTEGWLQREVLLDRTTHTYLGERSVAVEDHTGRGLDGAWTVRKGTIQLLEVRTAAGIVDRPGQRP